MDKRFAGILVAIIAVLGVVFVFTNKKTEAPSGNGQSTLSQHVTGKNTKKVNLTEYGDFQCPACYSYEPIVEQIREKYKDDIEVQFRHFPLTSIHKNAQAGARAAEAAAKQNKFWEMHDKLYKTQDPTGKSGWVASSTPLESYFVGFAEELGLNIATFKTDFASSAANDVITADQNEGNRLGVNSTPTFFLQGKKIQDNPRDIAGFSKLIDQAIKDANK